MLRIVITTTLMSLSTPRPLNVIPLIMSTHETITIAASNRLKPSIRNCPLLANVFRMISMKKIVKKTKSILLSKSASISKRSLIVRSNRMKILYRPIVSSDKFSMY